MPFGEQDGAEEPFGGSLPPDQPRTSTPNPPGPEVLSTAPPTQAPQPESDASHEGDGAVEVREFPPEHRRAFDGLMFVGKLTREFDCLGHRLLIRTVTADEVMEVGLLAAPWKDTDSAGKAYQVALSAAALVTIDGKHLPQPLTADPADSGLEDRFNWVRNLQSMVIERLYTEYLELEVEVETIMEAMGKASR